MLAHRLPRRAERVARKVIAKNGGPLALHLAGICLDKQPAGCRSNAKHTEVVVRNRCAGSVYRRAVGKLKPGILNNISSRHQRNIGSGGTQTLVCGIRNRPTLIEGGARSMDSDNFFRMRNRQLGQNHCIE